MLTCELCRQNLLPFLYDLLEEGEAKALRDHLENCPDCQVALEHARGQQGIVAEAARESFAQVRFTPPAEPVAPVKETLPLRTRSRRLPIRWAMAASILACTVGLASYLGYTSWQERHEAWAAADAKSTDTAKAAKTTRDDAKRRQEELRKEIREINAQVDELLGTWRKDNEKTRKVFERDQTKFIIEGPGSLQAGAKNEITIEVKEKSPRKGRVPMPLRAQLVNPETREVLFEKPLRGAILHRVTLPPDLPLKPGTKVALVVEAQDEKGMPIQVVDHLALVAPEYMTHLYLDRSLYRPGETVFFRSLTLERFSLKPAAAVMQLRIRLLDGVGRPLQEMERSSIVVDRKTHAPILAPGGEPVKGLATGEFPLPAELAPGEYAIEVADVKNRFPAEKRPFTIGSWEAPMLLKELKFDRGSYGPGEKVQIHGSVAKADGTKGVVEATAQVIVDGALIHHDRLKTDVNGKYSFGFKLPEHMARGAGAATVTFDVDGVQEEIAGPLPIVLNKVLVDFYPEGGNLVAGMPNRVYFQARTSLGKPADVAGMIVDAKDNIVAKAQTVSDPAEPGINQGMGVFELTPAVGERYRFKIAAPKHLDEPFRELPEAKADGLALHLPRGVVREQIAVELQSTKDRDVLVGAYCRGKLLDHVPLRVRKGEKAKVSLRAPPGVSGVYRITVFEQSGNVGAKTYTPLAERLIYSKGGESLRITSSASGKTFEAGRGVEVDLQVRDKNKHLTPSILLVSVVDQALLKLADDRRLRSMPAHFLLTNEVRRPEDLENADVLLGAHPRAEEALDLLLGVQGWRRFAEQEPKRFEDRVHYASTRFLGSMASFGRKTVDPDVLALQLRKERHAADYVALQKKLAQREKEEGTQESLEAKGTQMQTLAQEQAASTHTARASLEAFQATTLRTLFVIACLAIVLLSLLLIRIGLVKNAHGDAGNRWLVSGAAALGLLLVAIMAGMSSFLNRTDVAINVAMAPDATELVEAPAGPKEDSRPEPLPPSTAAKVEPTGGGKLPDPQTVPKAASTPSFGGPVAPAGGMGAMGGFGGGGAPKSRPTLAPTMPPPGLTGPLPPSPVATAPGGGPMALDMAIAKPPTPKFGSMRIGFAKTVASSDAAGTGPAEITSLRPGGSPVQVTPIAPKRESDPRADSELRRAGRFEDLVRRHASWDSALPAAFDPSVLREYAFREKVGPSYQEMVLWQPVLVLPGGQGKVAFDVPARATSYQVLIFAHTEDGKLGGASFDIIAK